jgi:hypothetical protein
MCLDLALVRITETLHIVTKSEVEMFKFSCLGGRHSATGA